MAAALVPAVIAAVFIAIMAALVVWTFAPVLRAFLVSMSQLPLIGAAIFGRAVAISDATVRSLAGWAAAGISPLTDLVTAVTWRFYYWRRGVVGAMQSTQSAVWRIRWMHLPALQKTLVAYANLLYNTAIAYANQLYDSAIRWANFLYNTAIAYAVQLYNNAIGWANLLYAQAISYAGQLYGQAIGYAQAVLAQALGYAQAVLAQALGYAQAVLAQALGFAEDAFGRSIDYERQLYGQAIEFGRRVGTAAEEYAQALFKSAVAYTDASMAAVLVRVLRLERSKCQQYCEPLGDLGSLLQQAEDTGLALALLALAVEASRDPRGTARAVDGLIGPTVRDLLTAIPREEGVTRAA